MRVGFRRVEIRDRAMLINGKRVMIKGVCRHDHDDEGGKTVPRERMRQDVVTMKRFNINAVRTSHYPNDPYFLDLCDEYGLYVIDEANIEAHALHNLICRDPRYAPAFLDHMMNMVQRDKNHPCIYAWSLGNESGGGPNHDAIAGWTRGADPTRLLHYEGGLSKAQCKFDWGTDPTRPITWDDVHRLTDIVCPMHMAIDEMTEWCRTTKDWRPMIVCEFAHAMGNGSGALGEYYDAFENTPGLQGGFVWQWMDHGIKQRDAQGREYWAYGGDFGDQPNDANFLCDGLVWPDRTPHSGLYELKKLAQPVGMAAVEARAGRVRITNKQDFTTLAWLRGTWELSVNGKRVQAGETGLLRTPPGASEEVRVPFKPPVLTKGDECFLTMRFSVRGATPWCDAGHEVALGQFAVPLPARGRVAARKMSKAAMDFSENSRAVTVRGGRSEIVVSKKSGTLTSWRRDGCEMIVSGPRLNVWRAPTDNDGVKAWSGQEQKPLGRWLAAGLNDLKRSVRSFSARNEKGRRVVLEIVHHIAARGGNFEHREVVSILPTGEVAFQHFVVADKSLPDLPRIGMELTLMPALDRLEWFGNGPHESYADRKRGALVGRYEGSVAKQYVPYIMPQSHGNKTDVRWFSLRDGQRDGLMFSGGRRFDFSASHFTADDLFRALHTVELEPRPEVFVTMDHLQRGLGTSSCGPDALPKYRIPPGSFRFVFRMVPVNGENEP